MSSLLLALAEDTTAVRLSYDAPASCPTEAAFYDAIQARTDHVRRATSDEAALEISVRVSRSERGFSGEVRETVNHTESSARSVDGATCKEVVEALSLTIALSVDPNAHAPVATPPTPTPAPVVCPPLSAQPRVVVAPAVPPVELEIGLSVLATEILTSDLSLGAALSGALSRKTGAQRRASLELALLFSATGVLTGPGDHRAQFDGIALDACPASWQFGSVELGPCALVNAGVLEVTGRGVSDPETVERDWWSAGFDAELSAVLGHGLVLHSALGATAPLIKRRFYISLPEHVIAETPVVSPLLRLGLGFRF